MNKSTLIFLPLLLSLVICRSGQCADTGTLLIPAAIADTRGPVINAHMNVVTSPDGVQAPGYEYAQPAGVAIPPNDVYVERISVPLPGAAKWITAMPAPMPAPGDTVILRPVSNGPVQGDTLLLRKVVTLGAYFQIQASVTAGAPFRLYVNGKLADRGPADSGRDYDGVKSNHWFYDRRDLTALFHQGKNVIVAEIMSGQAPFLFAAEIPGKRPVSILSDESWHGIHTDYLGGGGAQFDGTKEPIGWQGVDFDDSAWPACVVTQGVQATLTASELPPCMEARYPLKDVVNATPGVTVPDAPLQPGHPIIVKQDGSFTVRFPRILAAYLGIKVVGGGGAKIELQPHETNTPGFNNNPVDLTLRDGLQYYEATGFASVGVINVIVSHVTTPVEIDEITADFTSQPVAYQGSFACSDAALNRIWKSSRWSTQLCMQTWHLDSPHHQEPISDYGDYLIADRVTFDAFGNDPWLAKQDLRKWAWVMQNHDYHTFHTSYTLLWLQSLMQYYDFTGDLATVKELSPYVFALLDRFAGYRGKNGLISNAPNYMFMDWVTIEGFEAHHPPAVIGQGYMTAFYINALSDAARVAKLTGDPTRAAGYLQTRADTVAAYNNELWDPAKGLYRDGKPFQSTVAAHDWLPADRDIQSWSAQNNSLAVLYDIAPKDRQKMVIDNTMAQTPWNVRPYFMHFVLGAIAHAGLFDKYGAEWIRKWNINPDTQTSLEMGDQGDLSHGWIATPVIRLSEDVLGISPASPAFKTIAIRPHFCDLTWAKGSVPTSYGPVNVSWYRAGDNVKLIITVPPGTTATAAIPASTFNPVLTVNGKKIWVTNGRMPAKAPIVRSVQRTGQTIDVGLAPGTYTFVETGGR